MSAERAVGFPDPHLQGKILDGKLNNYINRVKKLKLEVQTLRTNVKEQEETIENFIKEFVIEENKRKTMTSE